MVVHIEAPLRCNFWLERQTTLQSRKRLGIFKEAANTSPERMVKPRRAKIGCIRRRLRGERLREVATYTLLRIGQELGRIASDYC
jgi:hypothetical protein